MAVTTRRVGTSIDAEYDRIAPFRKIIKTHEFLDLILGHLVPVRSNLVPPEDRNSLSQESFAAFPPFPDIAQIGIFVL